MNNLEEATAHNSPLASLGREEVQGAQESVVGRKPALLLTFKYMFAYGCLVEFSESDGDCHYSVPLDVFSLAPCGI